MKRFAYAVLALLLFALYVYFFGTPWFAEVTGLSPRVISLGSGFAVMLLGIAGMMIGKFSASRPYNK